MEEVQKIEKFYSQKLDQFINDLEILKNLCKAKLEVDLDHNEYENTPNNNDDISLHLNAVTNSSKIKIHTDVSDSGQINTMHDDIKNKHERKLLELHILKIKLVNIKNAKDELGYATNWERLFINIY